MTHHCQICEREIKASKGLIAHHGYKRPGNGWQTDSCMGARYLPYEKSRDLIPEAIRKIDVYVQLREAEIARVKEGKSPVPSMFAGKQQFIQPDDPIYPIRQREHVSHIEWEVKLANKDKVRLQKRYDEWRLIPWNEN